MLPSQKHLIAVASTGLLSVFSFGALCTGFFLRSAPNVQQTSEVYTPFQEEVPTPSMLTRQAERLKKRIAREHRFTPSVTSLAKALAARNELLKGHVTVQISTEKGDLPVWDVRVANYAHWLSFGTSTFGAAFTPDESIIRAELQQMPPPGILYPQDAQIISMETSDRGTVRARTDAQPSSGYVFDIPEVAKQIVAALASDTEELSVPASFVEGMLTHTTDTGPQTLRLLASGISNYAHSPANRISNIHKAINEYVNGVVVQPGETFSFNAMLDGPVTLQKGWKEALGLFGGGTAMTPGGGICQAATTVYRAAVLAGLPVLKRKAHSVYVSYYERYGVGIDATIFPGTQDLVFLNDTSSILVFQAHVEGEDIRVSLYGIPDGRTVTMEGPFFASTAPKAILAQRRGLAYNEIGWIQHIDFADGSSRQNILVSTYQKGIPRSLVTKYKEDRGVKELYAAAKLAMQ